MDEFSFIVEDENENENEWCNNLHTQHNSHTKSPKPCPTGAAVLFDDTNDNDNDNNLENENNDCNDTTSESDDAQQDLCARLSQVVGLGERDMRIKHENPSSNIEYKLKLSNPADKRFQKLVTQLNFRLLEGGGEAFYMLGVHDDGSIIGISRENLETSIQTLKRMGDVLDADVAVVVKVQLNYPPEKHPRIRNREYLSLAERWVCEVSVRRLSSNSSDAVGSVVASPAKLYSEVRVALCGQVGSGKTTLVAVLTQGDADDGEGRARVQILRHRHEVTTGHTSALAVLPVAFDYNGNLLNILGDPKPTASELAANASKIISLHDVAGEYRFLSTMISGIVRAHADYGLLVVSLRPKQTNFTNSSSTNESNQLVLPEQNSPVRGEAEKTQQTQQGGGGVWFGGPGLTPESEIRFRLLLALHSRVFVVVTHADAVDPNELDARVKQVCEGVQAVARSEGVNREVVIATQNTNVPKLFTSGVIPLVVVSNVTGDGISSLLSFLHALQPVLPNTSTIANAPKFALNSAVPVPPSQMPLEFVVDDVFTVDDVGTVTSGVLLGGTLRTAKHAFLGPFTHTNLDGCEDFKFERCCVKSIHMSCLPVKWTPAVRKCSVAIDKKPQELRRGLVVVESPEVVSHCVRRSFVGKVRVLHGTEPLKLKGQVVIYCRGIRQAATIKFDATDQPNTSRGSQRDSTSTNQTREQSTPRLSPSLRFSSAPHVLEASQTTTELSFDFQRFEFIPKDSTFVLRQGRCIGVGQVL